MNTFTPAIPPSSPSSEDVEADVTRVDFGDGYSQLASNGVNPVSGTFTATWELLEAAQADAIETFLGDNAGAVFRWTPPGEVSARMWSCAKWRRTWVGTAGARGLELTLKQEFRA